MPKKTIKILLALISIIILVFVIYFFFFRESDDSIDPSDREELFDPFGSPFPTTTFDDPSDENIFPSEFDEISKLKQITSEPVSGFEFFVEEFDDGETNEEQTVIKYIERATGHIYQTTFDFEENNRISNLTVPKNYESLFVEDGDKIIYRFLEDDSETIITYLSDFQRNTSESEVADEFAERNDTGTYLVNDLTQIIKSPAGELFGLMTNKSNSGFNSLGFIIDTENTEDVDVILNSQISEWTSQWIGEDRIALTTRTSYKSPGYAYILNLDSGLFLRDLGPNQGLSTKYSPDGSYVLYSTSDGSETQSFIYDRRNDMEVRSFVGTIADKCVWSDDSVNLYCATPFFIPDGIPDLWYKGLFQFNDFIITYNMEDGNLKILNQYDPENTPSLDIINMKISDDNDFILFQNKMDLSLWAYDLRE